MSDDNHRQVISYLHLRRAIGILGVSFPVLLAGICVALCDCTGIEDSLSDYYDTDVRDLFVGVLFVIGLFLFSYKGYERADDLAGDLACAFALGVALFPTNSDVPAISTTHTVCATGLFLVLAYFSLFLFTKSGDAPTDRKRMRNRVYRICGAIMLACIALIAIYSVFLTDTGIADLEPVFWLESMALWAFGVSWITKGEMLWPDRPPPAG